MEALRTVIEQAAAGDPNAFGTIVQRFQDMAVGYAFSILGDFHLAEDAAQEAFVQAYRDLHQLCEPAAFPGWFRRVVFKRCDRLTRGRRLEPLPLESVAEIASAEPGPIEAVEIGEMNAIVHDAIQALPEHERRVTTLFYISDYSQNEIADFLDVPVSTVKKRLYNARKRLRERMMTMVQEDLQGSRPSKDKQFVDRVLDLVEPDRKAHSEGIYTLFEVQDHPAASEWRQGRMAHSHLDWKTSRIGCINDQVVSVFGVYDIAMRIGTARVRAAGFNLDATHPDYDGRRQELMEKTALASIAAMRDQGYDLSVTFGSASFFFGLGYVFVWREMQWYVRTDELPLEPPDFELYEFTPDHREDLAELYNRENESLTGTAVKPTYLRNKHPGVFRGWFWTDSRGNPAGYVSGGSDGGFSLDPEFTKDLDRGEMTDALRLKLDEGFKEVRELLSRRAVCTVQNEGSRWLIVDGRRRHLILKAGDKLNVFMRDRSLFWVDESAGDPDQRLQALGMLARQSGCEVVFFDRLHYKSILGKRLRRMASCQIQPDSHGGQQGSCSYFVRIINLRSLFENLASELSRRLKRSPLADWSGNLAISNGEEEVMLVIDCSEVSVEPAGEPEHAIRGGQEIAQLVVGTETPDEIVEMNNIQLSGDGEQLIETLFPAQYPQMENQAL